MDLNIPSELFAAAKEMTKGGFNLHVPKDVEAAREGGWARWSELVEVEAAYAVPATGREGQQRACLRLKMRVQPFENSPNVGRVKTEFMYFNPTLACGSGDPANESKMNSMTLAKVAQLCVAAGIDPLAGGSVPVGVLFPFQADPAADANQDSVLVGKRLLISVADNANKKQKNGENDQKIDVYVIAEEV